MRVGIKKNISKQAGMIFIILAAVLLEVISASQYYYTRGMLERNLELRVLGQLRVSALRMDAILTGAETTISNQIWHARLHLDDPHYMEMLISNLVKSEGDKIVGAAFAFRPDYFADKGHWYEPYARQDGDSVLLSQIGSAEHDYTAMDFYNICIKGDTMKWTTPYLDPDGAHAVVTTYALPVRNEKNEPVAVLAVDVTTEWISETVNRNRTQMSSFTMVLSPDGGIIAQPADSLCSVKLANQIANMIHDSSVEKEEKLDGKVTGFDFYDEEQGRAGRVYYAMKKKAPLWQMVIVCYDDEAFGELLQMRKNIMWKALFGLLVLGLIVHLFARSIRRLHTSEMKQERIDGELKIAADIQTQMLPRESSVNRTDISLYGSLTPAREVGGDLFDFFIRDEKLFFCVGDVSGKGVPSAMLMAVVHSLFRSASLQEDNPARIMQTINSISCNGNDSNMFVTLFIGILDLPTGRMLFCNAGHDRPFMLADGELKQLKCRANLPIGVFSDMEYGEEEVVLPQAATFFIYTDGLTEAKRAQHDMFGLKRVMNILSQWSATQPSSPQALIQQMTEDVKRFTVGQEQSDDLTMFAFTYRPTDSLLTERR